jgi:hypothetical protein
VSRTSLWLARIAVTSQVSQHDGEPVREGVFGDSHEEGAEVDLNRPEGFVS